MWKIWKEEVYKIASRKIIWLGLFFLMFFVGWRLFAERISYTVTIDGQIYYGQEAIEKDQKLTAAYAGILTEEKIQKIYQDFGFYYYDSAQDIYVGNFCNAYITRRMTNYNQLSSESLENIRFLEGEAWEQNAAPLLNGDVRFDYVYGWDDLKEVYSFVTIMALFVLFMIGLSPVFSEEYTLKTANILLTTQRGKGSGIWMKMAAAFFLTIVIYCLFTAYLWLLYGIVYGTQGLDASSALLGISYAGGCPSDILGFFLFSFALGLAGLLLLTSMTLAVSALCKNAFLSVIVSITVFLLPYAWINVLPRLLPPFLGRSLFQAVSHVMISMPFYLPMNWGFAFSAGQLRMHLGIAFGVGILCVVFGYHRFRNYQG